MSLRRTVALGCLAAAMTVLAGCGLPVENSPQAIPASEIPLSLRQANQPPFIVPRILNATPVAIYLLGPDSQLIRVPRYLHPPPGPQKILDSLEAGPSPRELNLGIQSAIPPAADLVAGGVSRGVLTVLLDQSFGTLRPGQATYEFAQIVYSVTFLENVHGVLFKYDGGKIEPETGTGSIATNYIVTRADYKQLAP
jgi:spore germination protein GerM